MRYDFRTERKNESGAIMLEIIAVLALTGVMGAMLFRQINHRNQELHNIQMASEIRIAKEALSSWIQTNLAVLRRDCPAPSDVGAVSRCSYPSAVLGQHISGGGYLPDGYSQLKDDYDFSLFVYWRGSGWDATPVYYGVVVPKKEILPDEGKEKSTWNFKRAARVAMLIGADGGVYGPGITHDSSGPSVSGSVGAWQLPIAVSGPDVIQWECAQGGSCGVAGIPVYVALTGFDVYQPEVEVEDSKINVPVDWDLVTKNFGSYGHFVVGASNASDCFTIRHDIVSNGDVNNDEIHIPEATGKCKAVLWIDGSNADSKVFVRTGMEVGYDPVTSTSSISMSGSRAGNTPTAGQIFVADEKGRTTIVLDGTNTISSDKPANTLTLKDGKILVNKHTGEMGDSNKKVDYQYQLDPANTSVVYDIRLGALGGNKLSDLLPKYILKDVNMVGSSNKIEKPSCPAGYKKAVLLIPGAPTSLAVNGAGTTASGTLTLDGNDVTFDETTTDDKWNVNSTGLNHVYYQTYCVLDNTRIDNADPGRGTNHPDVYDLDADACKAMGLSFNSTNLKCTTAIEASTITDEVQCRKAGYIWKKNSAGKWVCSKN